MLETSQERVELLKAGITGKAIEELYIFLNDFKIVHLPVISESNEILENKNISEAAGEYGIV